LTATLHRPAHHDHPAPGVFEAIFRALDADSADLIGPTAPQLLAIPIRDDTGAVAGGFWGCTLFRWLHVQMLFVPAPLRGQGIGSALIGSAETEARERGCLGARLSAGARPGVLLQAVRHAGYPNAPTSWVMAVAISRIRSNCRRIGANTWACSTA